MTVIFRHHFRFVRLHITPVAHSEIKLKQNTETTYNSS